MSLPSAVFVAPRGQITADLAAVGPTSRMLQFKCSGLDIVKMATLATICLDEDLSDTEKVVARCPEIVAESTAGDAWIFPFPAETAQALAGLDSRGREKAALAWGETEEWAVKRHG